MRSLRGQLAAWLLLPLSLVVVVSTLLDYQHAVDAASAIQDRLLLGAARIIGHEAYFDDGVPQVVVPPAALELFESDTRVDRVYYRVATWNGELLLGYLEVPPFDPPPPDEARFHDAVIRGQPVRVVTFSQPVSGDSQSRPVVIAVAQTTNDRSAFVRGQVNRSLQQQVLILVASALLLWTRLHRLLAPVVALRDRIRGMKPGSLEPLAVPGLPAEIAPVLQAVNDLIQRLSRHQADRERFVFNASHQLRTPLTILQTQAAYALRCEGSAAKDEALHAIEQSVGRGARVVHQMLSLSSVEGVGADVHGRGTADLQEVVTRVFEQCAGFAAARNVEMGCESTGSPRPVIGSEVILQELLSNLVDNAIRYGAAGGAVTVGMQFTDAAVAVSVIDNGPGIPVDQREQVFERFVRLDNTRSDGCGLGLAIAREIAKVIGASLELAEAPRGGLCVQMRMEVADQRGMRA